MMACAASGRIQKADCACGGLTRSALHDSRAALVLNAGSACRQRLSPTSAGIERQYLDLDDIGSDRLPGI